MYQYHIKSSFDSAHVLPEYCGRCSNLHGHTWNVHFYVAIDDSVINQNELGLGLDFKELKQIVHAVCDPLDHQLLNKVIGEPVTAERISHILRERFVHKLDPIVKIIPEETYVKVFETVDCGVAYKVQV